MKTASEWNVANRVAKHRRNLTEAKRKEEQVTKSLALPPVLPESVSVFASLVRCRLTWIEKCSRPKSRNLLHRVFLGEFIRTCAKALDSNPHAIATSMAGKLATGGFPIETFHLTDAKRFRDREIRNHRPAIEARFSALCVDNFVPQTPANAEESAYLQGLSSLAENQVIDALWEGYGIISYQQLSDLLQRTGYEFKRRSTYAVRKSLLDWIEESKVPSLFEICLRKNEYSPSELLTLARLGAISGYPTSKKTMQKRGKIESSQAGQYPNYHAKISEYRELWLQYNMIDDCYFVKSEHALLPRILPRLPANLRGPARFSVAQSID